MCIGCGVTLHISVCFFLKSGKVHAQICNCSWFHSHSTSAFIFSECIGYTGFIDLHTIPTLGELGHFCYWMNFITKGDCPTCTCTFCELWTSLIKLPDYVLLWRNLWVTHNMISPISCNISSQISFNICGL